MKTKFYKIEDIIVMELETENEFEYYVRDNGNRHFFESSFGVEKPNRFYKNDLKNLYHSGYFDFVLERD